MILVATALFATSGFTFFRGSVATTVACLGARLSLLPAARCVGAPTTTISGALPTPAPASALASARVDDLTCDREGKCEGSMCFRDSTQVLTPLGEVPIAALRVGDMVVTRSQSTSERVERRIARVIVTPSAPVMRLSVARDGALGAEDVFTTTTHPFHVSGVGWVSAGALALGDVLTVATATAPTAEANAAHTRVVALEQLAQAETVYNLEVEDEHTFVVGESQLWVHNQCDPALLRLGIGPGAAALPAYAQAAAHAGDDALSAIVEELAEKNGVKVPVRRPRKGRDVACKIPLWAAERARDERGRGPLAIAPGFEEIMGREAGGAADGAEELGGFEFMRRRGEPRAKRYDMRLPPSDGKGEPSLRHTLDRLRGALERAEDDDARAAALELLREAIRAHAPDRLASDEVWKVGSSTQRDPSLAHDSPVNKARIAVLRASAEMPFQRRRGSKDEVPDSPLRDADLRAIINARMNSALGDAARVGGPLARLARLSQAKSLAQRPDLQALVDHEKLDADIAKELQRPGPREAIASLNKELRKTIVAMPDYQDHLKWVSSPLYVDVLMALPVDDGKARVLRDLQKVALGDPEKAGDIGVRLSAALARQRARLALEQMIAAELEAEAAKERPVAFGGGGDLSGAAKSAKGIGDVAKRLAKAVTEGTVKGQSSAALLERVACGRLKSFADWEKKTGRITASLAASSVALAAYDVSQPDAGPKERAKLIAAVAKLIGDLDAFEKLAFKTPSKVPKTFLKNEWATGGRWGKALTLLKLVGVFGDVVSARADFYSAVENFEKGRYAEGICDSVTSGLSTAAAGITMCALWGVIGVTPAAWALLVVYAAAAPVVVGKAFAASSREEHEARVRELKDLGVLK